MSWAFSDNAKKVRRSVYSHFLTQGRNENTAAIMAETGLSLDQVKDALLELERGLMVMLQPGTFDVVHARLVLVHVADRERALRSMIEALRPGGRLLVEDADPALQPLICPDEYGPEQALANRLRSGFRTLLAERGADLSYGRRLPRLLREAGLVDVAADAYFPVTSPACDALEAATVEQVRGALVARGLATEEEIDRHLRSVAAGRLDLATSPMISAWGRRP